MMEGQGNNSKHIKACILGGERVGKSHLAHKLANRDYLEYTQTKECQTFLKDDEEKHETFAYYDYPPFYEKMTEDLSRDHKFEVMICIFKDSTSFGQLYEFFEAITNKSEENDEDFKSYWRTVKKIVLVYSNYEEKGKVQIAQLFAILSQQIRNFNQQGTITDFVLKKNLQNAQQLHKIIQDSKYEDFVDKQVVIMQDVQLKDRLKLARSKRLSQIKDNLTIKSRDFSKSFNVETEAQEKKEEYLPDHEYVEVVEVKQEKSRKHQPQAVGQAHQADQVQQMPNIILPNQPELKPEDQNINNEREQHQPAGIYDHNNDANIKTQVPENNSPIVLIRSEQERNPSTRQMDNYTNIMTKLLEKINDLSTQPQKKIQYQDLFEQFLREQEDNKQVTEQQHSYWMERLKKIEQPQSVQVQARPQNQQIDEQNGVQIDEVRQVAREQEKPLNPQSKLLPPTSNISAEKPRRQKQAKIDSQSCACIIM